MLMFHSGNQPLKCPPFPSPDTSRYLETILEAGHSCTNISLCSLIIQKYKIAVLLRLDGLRDLAHYNVNQTFLEKNQ